LSLLLQDPQSVSVFLTSLVQPQGFTPPSAQKPYIREAHFSGGKPQTKGQITELKFIKRQMYGRTKINLL
jgi:hypothetical protein